MKYDFAEIERRWQEHWAQNKTFRTPNPGQEGFDPAKPKYYVLDMFPYPSGVGLHVGHPLGYIATDIVARYRRMLGFNVLHPMGYDAFGLPAEQFAVEHGVHPRVTTERNIETMTRQLKRLGLSYDWDRCLATTDPGYYRWTQWIFLQMYHSWYDRGADQARPIAELEQALASGQVFVGPNLELVDAGVEEGLAGIAGEPVGCRKWSELTRDERREVLDQQRLAYLAEVPVNWCPALGTVLANEEVTAEGRSERGNHPVVKRPLKQWMLRITAYGDRLLDDLGLVDWPDSIKIMQRNWIGRSEGAEVDFAVALGEGEGGAERDSESDFGEGTGGEVITVFTTRPDTLFGATYLVLAPEHPLVERLTTREQAAEVARYRQEAQAKTELDRQLENREKTGVFTGSYAVNPVNGERVPIWIADYVLMGYGTGAIMAVPAHDGRDFEFAQRFGLPIRDVVYTPLLAALSAFCRHLDVHTWKELGEEIANQMLVDFLGLCINQSRTDYDEVWHTITTRRIPRTPEGLEISARGMISSIWQDAIASLLEPGMEALLAAARENRLIEQYGNAVSEPGVNVNSSNPEISLDGMHTYPAMKAITDWLEEKALGRGVVRYKLRDWLFSRQRYWGEPFPVAHTEDGQVVALAETALPVELPEMEDFKPTADSNPDAAPKPPLGRAPQSWREIDVGGVIATRELNTMPQWAGSCWYYLRFCDPTHTERFTGSDAEYYWMGTAGSPRHPDQAPAGGVDLYIGGAEHAVLHLLYARFWHKVLFDLGHVTEPEPFGRLFNQGYIQAHAYRDERGVYVAADKVEEKEGRFYYEGQPVTQEFGKMGKSLKNAVAPDDVCEEYGCDTLRLYEMYLGPLDQSKVWRTRDIVGVHRFLQRVWRNFVDESGQLLVNDEPASPGLRRGLHKTIKKVTEDLGRLSFNTAIAALIELNNEMVQLPRISREVAGPFVLLLSPLAPHIAEELWSRLGHGESLAYERWPVYNPELLVDETIEYPVQINGRLRSKVTVPCNADQAAVRIAVLSDDKVLDVIGEKSVRKVIIVKDRLVNIVLEA